MKVKMGTIPAECRDPAERTSADEMSIKRGSGFMQEGIVHEIRCGFFVEKYKPEAFKTSDEP